MTDLNDYLLPVDSPIAENQAPTTAFAFDAENEAGVISSVKIRNAAITNAKIGTAAIGTANIGTLTFNEITGGTARLGGTANGDGVLQIRNAAGTVIIQGDNLGHHYYGTAGTNQLIQVDSDAFHAYNSSGSESFQIGTSGFIGFGTAANLITLRQSVGGVDYGRLGYGTAAGMWIIGTPALYLEGLNNINELCDIHSIFALNSGTSAFTWGANNGGINIKAGKGISMIANTSNFDVAVNSGNFNLNCNNFVLNSVTKTAIVPTTKGYRALYTNESPEVWFMDFCDSKDNIDPLFLEVTRPPYHFIKCEGGEYQVWGKRKGHEGVRFEEKSEEQFRKNNEFWNMPNT